MSAPGHPIPENPLPAANLLGGEVSPYLLQHAANPVHWRPWSPAALAEAKAQQKPILLSIGYAACHWCHVMAHESFENADTAALMNQLFVCIKVDREERPEIDAVYMNALHLLGEQGGWPLTMFLTPDGEAFWGGTYFPPEPRWGRPSFQQVLRGLSAAWTQESDKVQQNASAVARGLARMAETTPGPVPLAPALQQAANSLLRGMDSREGGMGGAPKFPNAPLYRFLWQMQFRLGDTAPAEATSLLLHRMSQGGIWDHLGGGYARYSVDAIWLAPHFEKMLYDNAQLLELLAFAHAATPTPLFAARAAELVTWLQAEMMSEGAFAASLDADSEGEEGRFYVWSAAEIAQLLPPEDRALFCTVYDVTPEGNWEGHTILNRRAHPDALSPAEEARLAQCRALLLQHRASRIRPGRDDKLLADWNGLMITALLRAAAVFEQPQWAALATSAYHAIVRVMGGNHQGTLGHAWRAGRQTADGLLEDYAAMARAALALFEASGDATYLTQAITWAEAVCQRFAAPGGGYFTSAAGAVDVPLRHLNAGDNATPSGNGMIAEVFARLYHLTGNPLWRERAEGVIGAFAGLEQAHAAMPGLLAAADLLTDGAVAVVTGPAGDTATEALAQTVLRHADPAITLLRAAHPDAVPEGHPAHGKGQQGDQPAAYLCRNGSCALPVSAPTALLALLDRRPTQRDIAEGSAG